MFKLLGRTVYFLTYDLRFKPVLHNSQYIVTINQEQCIRCQFDYQCTMVSLMNNFSIPCLPRARS